MSPRPWLSVIVPVYNGERYLKAALDSVLAQTDDGTEVVVADDGSTDGSRNIVAACAGKGRIVEIEGTRSGNWVTNTNRAVAHSRGRLVTFLHQDDLWLPGRCDWIRRTTARYPSCSLWLGPTRFADATGRLLGTWRLPLKAHDGVVESQLFLEHLLVQNFIGMPAPVFTRAAFDRSGGMDTQLWFTADWDLWLKLGASTHVGVSITPTTAFRLHALSQTITRASAVETMGSQIDTVRERYLTRLAGQPCYEPIVRAGRFSREVNVSLARAVAGTPIHWRRLLASFFGLGLAGGYRYARDARLLERFIARLRAGLAT